VFAGSGSVAYGASKGGIHGLALTLERALEPRGIRVTEVAPGSVDTELFRRSVQEGLTRNPDTRLLEVAQGTAAPPEAVAAVMAFLASDDGAAVRGLVRTC
jgi:NAD(P)-dependent dehydrogenase (short-subunit alcohol dehydrogenase family)